MNSNKWKEFEEMILVSERDVESKVLIKRFFSLLGYDDRDRAENHTVEWWAGREKQSPKYADQVYFNGSEWNIDTSLVVAEAKKPSEKVDAFGQAQFYSMWLRTPYYVLCNGEEIVIVLSDRYKADKELLRCSVKEIPQHWAKIESILQKDLVIDYCNRNNLKSIKVGEVYLTEYLTFLSSQKSDSDFLPLFAKPQLQNHKIPIELKTNLQDADLCYLRYSNCEKSHNRAKVIV